MDKAGRLLREEIKRLGVPVKGTKDIEAIATIAAGNNEEFGRIIASAFERVGENGSTVVEESQSLMDDVDFSEGMELDRAAYPDHRHEDRQRAGDGATAGAVRQIEAAAADHRGRRGRRGAVDAGGEQDARCAGRVRHQESGLWGPPQGVPAGHRGAHRRKVIASDLGMTLEDVRPEDFGLAERVVIGKETTTIISDGSHEADVKERIRQIKAERETVDTKFDTEKCDERIARLGGGIARIRVGAATESELKDKKLRYEDAINSCRAAIEEGVLPGGRRRRGHAARRRAAAPRPQGAAGADRRERRVGGRSRPRQGGRSRIRLRLQRVHRRVWRYDQDGRYRPGQGGQQRHRERRQHRRIGADHRSAGGGVTGGEGQAGRGGETERERARGREVGHSVNGGVRQEAARAHESVAINEVRRHKSLPWTFHLPSLVQQRLPLSRHPSRLRLANRYHRLLTRVCHVPAHVDAHPLCRVAAAACPPRVRARVLRRDSAHASLLDDDDARARVGMGARFGNGRAADAHLFRSAHARRLTGAGQLSARETAGRWPCALLWHTAAGEAHRVWNRLIYARMLRRRIG
eukprot:ctg_730.g294